MNFDMMHPADQLVMFMARIYEYGLTTTSGGNLSIKDDNGDIWITPSAVDKGSLTRADIMQVKPDGSVIGPHVPSIELPFHKDIYRVRPDVRAVVHAHPAVMVAYSMVRRAPDMHLTPDTLRICGEVAVAGYELPGSDDLRRSITAGFEQGLNTVLMENHGVVCGAESLSRAYMLFETVHAGAAMELEARRLGTPLRPDRPLTLPAAPEKLAAQAPDSAEKAARRELCAMVRRACRQRLFTSAQGDFSMRLSDGSMLINPDGCDRLYIEPQELIRVKDGRATDAGIPRTAALHAAIYRRNPDISCVITAQPRAAMAFAVTGAQLDSRVIPESCVFLRDVLRLPFGACCDDPDGVAAMMSLRRPVALAANDCAVVTGHTAINAFDRLEVLECSSAAVIAAGGIGGIVRLNEAQIALVNQYYNLE